MSKIKQVLKKVARAINPTAPRRINTSRIPIDHAVKKVGKIGAPKGRS
ncbi:MAG: hypothetical protein GVY30_00140 [Chloroflexi bacterium]|nr:hypothetical protein [Chloroflexota bacterium]